MGKPIGIIGVPLEDQPFDTGEFYGSIPAYQYGITDETRSEIIAGVKKAGLEIVDLGEARVGEAYEPQDHISKTSMAYSQNAFPERDMDTLAASRGDLMRQKDDFSLLFAVGGSHLGAILLYDHDDMVSRFDYHADFVNAAISPFKFDINYANYMDWVAEHIKNPHVTNYFVHLKENGVLGYDAPADYPTYQHADLFDIDVDCFDPAHQMLDADVYRFSEGMPDAQPEEVLRMIREAKPAKIGVFEYRRALDKNKAGLEFMIEAIKAQQLQNR